MQTQPETTRKPVIFSGIQPSGTLTLGNYIGALRNFKLLEDDYDCVYCVVDLHALTVRQDPAQLRSRCLSLAAVYMAVGLDPDKSLIYCQSHVSAHAELAWILNCITYMGELQRMTQFKDKSAKHADNINAGLFTYPVLMAADILLYQTHQVPIGADQKQHLELARDIAQKFNNDYGPSIERNGFGNAFFPLPEPLISGPATRVMSLRDGTKKMSKSDASDYSRINLSDDADAIATKVKKAKTDPEPLPSEEKGLEGRPEADNLVGIFAALSGRAKTDVLAEFGGANFSTFKSALVDLAVTKLSPITGEMRRIRAEEGYIDDVLRDGSERARAIARENMNAVKDIVGFLR